MAKTSVDEHASVCRSAPGSPAADDITQLILNDHEIFRREFARLDDLRASKAGESELARVWQPLADLLDVHAEAEEQIFYPNLLRSDAEDAREETLDAIGDHNDIRDGVEAAKAHPVGSDEWWQAVNAAREANDEHMGEEEGEGLADFRLNASTELRRTLGRRFRRFESDHAGTRDIEISNKDPERYVETAGTKADAPNRATAARADSSLGIGSLKGR
ncbi:MAG TPA: hemerythrin domain-containing protein [Pseudonocardia sp.]|jgi:hypothetical protein|nr:hemerythrin domain-containing protein [Pseudonocardia sp.]